MRLNNNTQEGLAKIATLRPDPLSKSALLLKFQTARKLQSQMCRRNAEEELVQLGIRQPPGAQEMKTSISRNSCEQT